MYPFRILVVKMGSLFRFRVVYQTNKEIRIQTPSLVVHCSVCPQINTSTIFLRGDWNEQDNTVHDMHTRCDVEHMLNQMNDEIKTYVSI
jgi:hypothetical protein